MSDLDINPYELLEIDESASLNEIKKVYHDKLQKTKSKLEIKVLEKCYNYCVNKVKARMEESRSGGEMNVYNTNLEDPEVRKRLFPTSTVDYTMDYSSRSKPRTREDISVENMFKDKKFDKDEFNKMFEKQKKPINLSSSFKPASYSPGGSLTGRRIASYGGLIVNLPSESAKVPSKTGVQTLNEHESGEVNIEEYINMKNKKNKNQQDYEVGTQDVPFARACEIAEQKKREKIMNDYNANKDIVMKQLSMFDETTRNEFLSGRMQSSSGRFDL